MTVASDPGATWFQVSVNACHVIQPSHGLKTALTMSRSDPSATRAIAPIYRATPSDRGPRHPAFKATVVDFTPIETCWRAYRFRGVAGIQRRAPSGRDPAVVASDSGLCFGPSMIRDPTTVEAASVAPSHVPSGTTLLAIALSELAQGIPRLDVLRRSVDRAPPPFA
jgi:hypothetical protein